MTDRWRLINGKELYDIREDPGQRNDLAGAQLEVVSRLRTSYETWWAELVPTFKREPYIYLGHEREDPVRLTSHDWIASDATTWNQILVRQA